MFRFSIREVMLVTLVVALVVGWCIDHRVQVPNSDTYAKAYEQWRDIAEMREQSHESVLRSLGFGIEKDGNKTTVSLPPSFRLPSSSP